MSTSKKAWIVTLDCRGSAPRAKFGNFLWNNTYGRYVWKGELATTMGQLAELFTGAAGFLRQQANYYLELKAMEVVTSEEGLVTSPEEGDETLASSAYPMPKKKLADLIQVGT